MINQNKKNTHKNIHKIKERNAVLIVSIILIVILLIAFLQILKTNSIKIKNVQLDFKPINVSLNGKDNKKHSLSVEFSIDGTKDINKLSKDNMILIVTKELQNLNYEDISGVNGYEKLKEAILKALNDYSEDIKNVYLKKFLTDTEVPEDNSNKNNTTDYLKGFKWSE